MHAASRDRHIIHLGGVHRQQLHGLLGNRPLVAVVRGVHTPQLGSDDR
jgi:hypothetical protein